MRTGAGNPRSRGGRRESCRRDFPRGYAMTARERIAHCVRSASNACRVVALMAALLFPAQAAAVSCGGRASLKESFDRAEHVFSAYVETHFTGRAFGRDDVLLARLRVLQVWKGDLHVGEEVTAGAEDSLFLINDGYIPLLEAAVLVYTGGDQPFHFGTCSRTGLLDEATGDIPRLNKLSRKKEYRPRD